MVKEKALIPEAIIMAKKVQNKLLTPELRLNACRLANQASPVPGREDF